MVLGFGVWGLGFGVGDGFKGQASKRKGVTVKQVMQRERGEGSDHSLELIAVELAGMRDDIPPDYAHPNCSQPNDLGS